MEQVIESRQSKSPSVERNCIRSGDLRFGSLTRKSSNGQKSGARAAIASSLNTME